jgi:hypothetical protein
MWIIAVAVLPLILALFGFFHKRRAIAALAPGTLADPRPLSIRGFMKNFVTIAECRMDGAVAGGSSAITLIGPAAVALCAATRAAAADKACSHAPSRILRGANSHPAPAPGRKGTAGDRE